jgi:hypothetical protein
MYLCRPSRLRFATALALLSVFTMPLALRAASKVKVVAIGDQAPGGGQFLGPSLTGTPASAGNGWVTFRSLVTSGGTSEQIVAKNMTGTVVGDAATYVVAEIGKSAGSADGKDLGSFKQFLGRPTVNGNGDVAFVATLTNSDRLPADQTLTLPNPAGLFLYRRATDGEHLSAVALSRTVFGGVGALDFSTTIDLFGSSLTAIDVPERTPALNDAGDVAFAAATDNGGTPGGAIFLAPGGTAPAPIVRLGDATTGGTFGVLGPPALNSARDVAFRGLLNEDLTDGVYRYRAGTVTPLVTTGKLVITLEPSPFQQQLFDFDPVVAMNDAGDIVFAAGPLIDTSLESTDIDGAPGVFLLHDDTLITLAYPGKSVPSRGRVTGLSLGADGGNATAPPVVSASGTVAFIASLNSGGQQALFSIPPPWNTDVIIPKVVFGGTNATQSPIGGTYQAPSSAPAIDAKDDLTFYARLAGAPASEALLFIEPDGGFQQVLVGDATPTKGLFGGPPFSSLLQTDSGDVYFKSFVAAGPSSLGLFRWRRQPNGKDGLTLVARTGDAAPLDGAPRIVDLVGDASANDSGAVAFAALVPDPTRGVARVLLVSDAAGVRKIAAPGDDLPSPPLPPLAGIRTVAAGPTLLPDGTVVFRATYDYLDPLIPFQFDVEDGLFAVDPAGTLRLLAHTGQASPTGTDFLRIRDSNAAPGPSIAFRSTLGEAFDIDPPLGLFVVDPSSAIRTVAVQGQDVGGLTVQDFSGRIAVDATGTVTFNGAIAGGTALVQNHADGSMSILAQVGKDGPLGGTIKSLSRPAGSSNGHVAYRASFEQGTGGVSGFYVATPAGTTPLVVVGESDAAGKGARLTSLNPTAALNASDHLAFIGTVSEGTARNGIFLASQTTMSAQGITAKIREISLDGKGRDVIRGRVTLQAGDLGDGFSPGKEAVTLVLSDTFGTYVNATISPKKLAKAGASWVLKKRDGTLRKLRLRAKRNTVRVSFAAGGLDLFALMPPITVRLDVGNDAGFVTVPCSGTDTLVTCPGS